MLEYKEVTLKNITFPIENKNNTIKENNFTFDDVNVNPIINNESDIVKIIRPVTIKLNFQDDNQFFSDLTYAGLTLDDINTKNKYFRYSNIIMFIFDDINISSQNFVHVSYIPLYNFLFNNSTSIFNLNLNDEYMYIYLNKEYEKNKIYYCRFYYSDIKNGKIYSFRNNNFSLTGDGRLYYEIFITDQNTAFFTVNNIDLFQINNIEYDNIVKAKTLENTSISIPFKNDKVFKINGRYFNII